MSYYSSTLQKGSQGSDVKKWQEFLNTQGYGLSVDGDFGTNTYNATIDYQKKNGLTVDGIVGKNTWGKAGFSNINTPVSAPTSSPLPTAPTYDSTSWDDTDKGKATAGAYDAAKDAVTNYGDYTWDKQGEYDALYDQYKNRDPFSYDFNADALYQQYKDMYMQQGKVAMQDAMGQAAAMTGGYGNSYAATVGNQAYQEHLGKLNDVIPELYQLAYSKYNQEGQDMLNAIGLLEGERAFDYGKYTDKYGRLVDTYGIASDDYYKGADMFYTEQGNKNSVAGQEFTDAMSIWDANNTNAWKTAEWDETQRRYELERAEDSKVAVKDTVKDDVKKEEEAATGFTGKTYESAVAYVEEHGVPSSHAAGIMTASEWSRRKASYKAYGQGGAEVKNYNSYAEYLADITEYLVEQYN